MNSNRQIRVFISSTFKDMQAERDHLVKFIFPQLRRLCDSRGVTWGEVDLRWGVTDEQAAEGKVLPICLEEIRRCRPYFVGLLGERYGWIPDTIPSEVIEREPWLKEHLHGRKSVTELEIIHGVLREEKMHGHAFFYFRDPAFIERTSANQRQNFISEDPESADKLHRLKDLIRHAREEDVCCLQENYPTPEVLGELVLKDLTAVIDKLFPEGSQPDPLDHEAMDHEAYAQSRERVYIGRQAYFDRLDTHAAANDTQPLVVLGESGSGKSALLANWVTRYRGAHPDVLVLQHYIGATPYSADWAAMLRRLMGEFKRRLGIQQDIPDQPDALRSAFPNWLYMAAAKSRIVLVLDALNQLEDRDGAPDLVWLPPVMPENVRLIVSTLPGRPLDEIKKRGWPTFKVELLSADERRKLIGEYLGQHAKSLSAARVERIATAPPSANPLYLRVLLDELRLVRTHEELEQRIGDYLKAESPYALYEKVIARWEQDYEGDTDLVGDTLSLLWAARRGLTETELLQALGKDGEPLPRAKWSPLFLAMSDALICRGGLLTFAHNFLRTAVRNAYLPSEQNQQLAYLHLADYFESQLSGPRRTDELPWQLAEARAWKRLYDLLADRAFLVEAWDRNQFEVKTYWTQIEDGSALRMLEAYGPRIEHAEAEPDKNHLWLLSVLLADTGHPQEALGLRSVLVEYFRDIGDLNSLQAGLGNQALILQDRGDLNGAMALHKEQERICRQLGNLEGLEASFGNQALILRVRGNLDEAMVLHKEAERICRQLGNLEGLEASFYNQALILHARGNLDEAMALHKEAEQICRQLGNLKSLHLTLSGKANILYSRGYLGEAMALHKEAERICRQLGDLKGLQSVLGNQGVILQARGDLGGAMALHSEAERICRQLGDQDGLSKKLNNQAVIEQIHGDPDEAMALHKEAERICRQLGNLDGLQLSLSNQGLILKTRGDLDGAMALHKEAERICRQLGNLDGLSRSLGNQAVILKTGGDLDGALALHKEEERISRQLGNLGRLTVALDSQAGILQIHGDLDGALARLEESVKICRQLNNAKSLAISLVNQAIVLKQMGQAQEGLALAEESLQLAVGLGYTALVEQIERKVNSVRQAAQSEVYGQSVSSLSIGSLSEPPVALKPSQKLAEIIELAERDPSRIQEITDRLKREDFQLFIEFVQWLQSHGEEKKASAESKVVKSKSVASPGKLVPTPQRPAITLVAEYRESAARCIQRGQWEAAETYLEKLLRQGEPVETVAPYLITALLNAHETISPATVTRIETLLAQLESSVHAALAAPLGHKLAAKLAASQPKKSWWKFGA